MGRSRSVPAEIWYAFSSSSGVDSTAVWATATNIPTPARVVSQQAAFRASGSHSLSYFFVFMKQATPFLRSLLCVYLVDF